MPASRSSSAAYALSALGVAQTVLGGAPETCSGDLQLSCHNSSTVENTCCFNAPGGSLLQTQFWDTDPAVGPSDSWTIHGLWPDRCDGSYDASCDDARAYSNISSIISSFGYNDLLSYMQTYWLPNSGTGETFWEHEWGKHGTCVSTLAPSCFSDYQPTEEVPYFFNRTVSLFKTLPTYDWLKAAGITPSSSQTYSLSAIQSALSQHHGGNNVYLGCTNGALEQVYYYFNVKGSVASGEFVAASPDSGSSSNCPSSGIKYLPKSGGGSNPSPTTTTSSGPQPTGTGGAFSGRGTLKVVTTDDNSAHGCVISAGKWYTSGTCATFTATASSSGGYTLKSSKGNCAIQSGAWTCASSVSQATVFDSDGSTLTYSGYSTWYADGVPSGSTQATVYAEDDDGAHGTEIEIQWAAA
ncbi:ribonuclease T2 [Polychaeton citri CBS 116435]|uniref:Ribonuclease T2-like n=1 Tax=Polychaeton citri CBS 116435 TaxID=1314669 RepID=A0A9P4Q3H3_9PEZI|nr:ribonuclease T2 [Polychaeton citri CBS 116435]